MLNAREFSHENYKILNEIAEGDLGPVFRALHLDSGKTCAIHLLTISLTDDLIARLREDVSKAASLNHPNIAAPGMLEEGERPFFVRDFIDGITLEELIRSEAPLPLARACSIARQIAQGLEAAHHAGITHGDLKPSSILLSSGNQGRETAKVLGLGTFVLKQDRFLEMARLALRNGNERVLGSPQYISPEQAVGTSPEALDGRSDVYSLGVIWHEMLTGETPFHGGAAMEVLLGHLFTEPRSLQSRPELNVPEVLDRLLMRTLAKRREDRPASATALVDQLSAWEEPAPAPQPSAVTAEQSPEAESAAPEPPAPRPVDALPPLDEVLPKAEPVLEFPSEAPIASAAEIALDLALIEPAAPMGQPAEMLPSPVDEPTAAQPEPANVRIASAPGGSAAGVRFNSPRGPSFEPGEARGPVSPWGRAAPPATELDLPKPEPSIAFASAAHSAPPAGEGFNQPPDAPGPIAAAPAPEIATGSLPHAMESQIDGGFVDDLAPSAPAPAGQPEPAPMDVPLHQPEPQLAAAPVPKSGPPGADAVIFGRYMPRVAPAKSRSRRSPLWVLAAAAVIILIACAWLYLSGRTYWFHPNFLKWRASTLISSSRPASAEAPQPAPSAASGAPSGAAALAQPANGAPPMPSGAENANSATAPASIAPMQMPGSAPAAQPQARSETPPAQATQPQSAAAPAANQKVPRPEAATASNKAAAAPQHAAAPVITVQQALARGDFYFDRGDYDRAIRAFNAGLAQTPGNQTLINAIARARRAKAAEAKFLGQ